MAASQQPVETSGLHRLTGTVSSQQLRRVIREWHNLHCAYVADSLRRTPGKPDCIWWSLERSNVGILAAAAWRADIPCVEEYSDWCGDKRRRVDLWLGTTDPNAAGGTHIEAKMLWLDADKENPDHRSEFTADLAAHLDAAHAQMEHINSPSSRLALVFVIPHVRTWTSARAWEPVWDNFEQAAQETLHQRAALLHEEWLSAWSTHPWQEQPLRCPDAPRGRFYPGVLMVGQLRAATRSGKHVP